MIELPNGEVSRTLPEQVGVNTERIHKLQELYDQAGLPDDVIEGIFRVGVAGVGNDFSTTDDSFEEKIYEPNEQVTLTEEQIAKCIILLKKVLKRGYILYDGCLLKLVDLYYDVSYGGYFIFGGTGPNDGNQVEISLNPSNGDYSVEYGEI